MKCRLFFLLVWFFLLLGLENANPLFAQVILDPKMSPEKSVIIAQISEAYEEAFQDSQDAGINKFCSRSFKKIYKEYQSSLDGMLGSIDYNLWVQAQDFEDLSMKVINVLDITIKTATVIISVQNMGEYKIVVLPVVYESGKWKIDDFVNEFHSAKSVMKNDIYRKSIIEI